jgi:zinc transport system substrate-binding protein
MFQIKLTTRQLIVSLVLLFNAFPVFAAERPETIIAGTSLISELVTELGGAATPTSALLPPNMCPGHFDIRPGDIDAVSKCRLFIVQSWQLSMPNISGVVTASKIPETRVKIAATPGNWMIPAARKEAARELASTLTAEFPDRATQFSEAAEKSTAKTAEVERICKERVSKVGLSSVKVVCNEQQADFARWAGLEVVQTYGRPEGMSAAKISEISTAAKKAGAALVVDNLQSGDVKMGETIARESGAAHVVLSNFPGGEATYDTWEKTFQHNLDKIISTLEQWRRIHG